MGIQSNSSTAGTCAQNIWNMAANLTVGAVPTKDSTSSFAGNSLASSNIDKEKTNAESISAQIKAFVNNVHTIASEFEATDNAVSYQLPLPSMYYGQNNQQPFMNNGQSNSLPFTNYNQNNQQQSANNGQDNPLPYMNPGLNNQQSSTNNSQDKPLPYMNFNQNN